MGGAAAAASSASALACWAAVWACRKPVCDSWQGGALALQPVQQAVLRQRVGGFRQQPRRLALRLLGVLLSLPVLPEPLRLLLLLPQGLLGLQLLRLPG